MMPIMQEVILLKHEEIVLTPKNQDYNPIFINEEDAEDFRIIGEFEGIIKD